MHILLPNPTAASPVGRLPQCALGQDLKAGAFPPVPTLLATRLQLELLLGERSVDLRAAAGIILNDLGATLEIFRRAGEDGECAADRRIEDCLASLGTEVWMEAVCADAVERVAGSSRHLAQLTAFWERSRSLAYACWLLAEDAGDLCPEQAYLVGLLHEARRLPAMLGWDCPPGPEMSVGAAHAVLPWNEATVARLAVHWQLPEFLRATVTGSCAPPCWRELLEDAHAWLRRDPFVPGYTA